MYSLHEDGAKSTYRDEVEGVALSVAQDRCLGLIGIHEPPALTWPDAFRAALLSPSGTPPLHELARGAGRIAIIVSDSTRRVPTAKVLPLILAELDAAGIPKSRVTVVVAIGVHRPATEEEFAQMVGADHLPGLRVVNHDPYDGDQLVRLGKTSCGTAVDVNRVVHEADFRIAIGKVEPHEFAGFSGGRKSVLPGVAGEKTIAFNHRPEMLLSPAARPGQLEGNPIHEDMVEAAGLLNLQFMVNLVLNQAGETVGMFAGDPGTSHAAAVAFLRTFCQVELPVQPDIVVTTPGIPLNIDFYQSVKPLIALAPVMAAGGVLVLYSACREGMGTEDMLIPYEGARDVEEVIGRLKADYRIQMDHALLLGKILLKGIRIIVAAPSIDAAILRKIFLTPAAGPQEALEEALKIVGKPEPTVLFFPQAQRALSVLSKTAKAS